MQDHQELHSCLPEELRSCKSHFCHEDHSSTSLGSTTVSTSEKFGFYCHLNLFISYYIIYSCLVFLMGTLRLKSALEKCGLPTGFENHMRPAFWRHCKCLKS